jgi:hypothetical protein
MNKPFITLTLLLPACFVWAKPASANSLIDEIFATQRIHIARLKSVDIICTEQFRPSKNVIENNTGPSFLRPYNMVFKFHKKGEKFRIETALEGSDVWPNQIRMVTAFDLDKVQRLDKNTLHLRVQSEPIIPSRQMNLPLTRPFRYIFLGQKDLSLTSLWKESVWNELKSRITKIETARIEGQDCILIEFDYSNRSRICRIHFASELLYYPVRTEVVNAETNKPTVKLVVTDVEKRITDHGIVIIPLQISESQWHPDSGLPTFTLRETVDRERLVVNEDIPDEVFTIPIHMARSYEDADDAGAYFSVDSVINAGLEELKNRQQLKTDPEKNNISHAQNIPNANGLMEVEASVDGDGLDTQDKVGKKRGYVIGFSITVPVILLIAFFTMRKRPVTI